MELIQPDNIIDYATDCAITRLAKEIESNSEDEIDFIANAYAYVCDNISHLPMLTTVKSPTRCALN